MNYEPNYETVEAALERLHLHIWLAAGRAADGPSPIREMTAEEAADCGFDMTAEELAQYNADERNRNLAKERLQLLSTWSAWQDIIVACGLPQMTADEARRRFSPSNIQRIRSDRLLREIFGSA